MKMRSLPYSLIALVTLAAGNSPGLSLACTTAVVSGKVTADGRPLLWKNRDTSTTEHNEVVLLSDGPLRAIAVVDAGNRRSVWMGVNEAGFCIENSLSRDLADSEREKNDREESESPAGQSKVGAETKKRLGNGQLMKRALQTCRSVADFRRLLEDTNNGDRATVANFGAIDAQGGAAMFETGPTSFTMFDANDPDVAPQGYVVRSNFATTAQDLPARPEAQQVQSIYAGERYLRACELIEDCPSGPLTLNYVLRNMTRDLADESGNALPGTVNGFGELPETISTDKTISRTTTVSAAVFHGVKPGEDPLLATMWTILGDPKFSIAVPCWVAVDQVADDLTDEAGGEIGEIAVALRRMNLTSDGNGVRTDGLLGIWEDIWTLEDHILDETERKKQTWFGKGLNRTELTQFHHSVTGRAMAAMEQEVQQANTKQRELLEEP